MAKRQDVAVRLSNEAKEPEQAQPDLETVFETRERSPVVQIVVHKEDNS